MRRLFIILLLCICSLGFAATEPSKALICSACHGAKGISPNPLWPNLAGQHSAYLLQQLQHYKSGKARSSPMMTPIVAALTEQDMADLADFYAKQPAAPSQSPPSNVALGERLYRQGDNQKHIPACIACHGPDGRGAEHAGFPMISHQQPEYVIQQLQAFKTGTRTTDPMHIMRTISEKLSAEEMRALSQYLIDMRLTNHHTVKQTNAQAGITTSGIGLCAKKRSLDVNGTVSHSRHA